MLGYDGRKVDEAYPDFLYNDDYSMYLYRDSNHGQGKWIGFWLYCLSGNISLRRAKPWTAGVT